MQTMVDGMTAHVKEHIRFETFPGLDQLPPEEQVVLCTPAYKAKTYFSGDREIYGLLDSITYLPLIAATLFFEKDSFTRMKKGFGCLVPEEEGCASRGILFNHDIYPGRVIYPAEYSLTFVVYPPNCQTALKQATKMCWRPVTGMPGTCWAIPVPRWDTISPAGRLPFPYTRPGTCIPYANWTGC